MQWTFPILRHRPARGVKFFNLPWTLESKHLIIYQYNIIKYFFSSILELKFIISQKCSTFIYFRLVLKQRIKTMGLTGTDINTHFCDFNTSNLGKRWVSVCIHVLLEYRSFVVGAGGLLLAEGTSSRVVKWTLQVYTKQAVQYSAYNWKKLDRPFD